MAPFTDDKSFRLPRTVLPTRYAPTLEIDLEGKRFEGRQTIDLELSEPTDAISLHASALDVREVTIRPDAGSEVKAEVTVHPLSDTVRLEFDTPVPAGKARLSLAWSGRFNAGLRGLYHAAGRVAATQFEAADARRVFPCFDEPAFKARWKLTVKLPAERAELVALANGRIAAERVEGKTRVLEFAETEVLASYLVALVVGPLEAEPAQKARAVEVRTWAVPEKRSLTAFGQEVGLAVLPMLEDYFGMPYAFDKVDQVAIPDFEAGAMENVGLVTYREVVLLLDPARASLATRKRIAEVVTHELSHQWFGNWVTMRWWDDLWLNEAFATWMSYKIVAKWKPEWRIWLDFDQGKSTALALDALASTHPIHGEVRNADEATESFDAITYEKGGAVLRMIEGFLGEASFRDGIRAYMKKHGRANAVADDLWTALAEASKEPVLEVANAWIHRSGFPRISCELKGDTVVLGQRRFHAEPGVRSEGTWPVPVVLRFSRGGKVSEQRVLFREAQTQVKLEGSGEVDWLCANGGNTGFYRVAYAKEALEKLGKNLDRLEPSERIALLSDGWALVRANEQEVGGFLDLVTRFGGETDYAVLDELVSLLGAVEARLVADSERESFQKVVVSLLGAQLEAVGWEPKPGEDDATKLRRAAVVRAVAGVGRDAAALAEIAARVKRLLAGQDDALEPNLLDPAVMYAARGGDAELFDGLLARFGSETEPSAKRRYLISLATFEAEDSAQRARKMLFEGGVPLQEVAFFFATLFRNRTARVPFWGDVQAKWDALLSRTANAPMLQRRLIEALAQLPERKQQEEVAAFLKAHPLESAKQAIAQTLERHRLDVAFRERAMPEVTAWLKRR